MSTCGYDGTAVIALIHDKPVWQRADDRIHVTAELLADENARTQIGTRYDIGEWCPEMHRCYHATKKETA